MIGQNEINPANGVKKYPLLPYSQLVWDIMKHNDDVYWTRFTLRATKADTDFERLKAAIITTLNNHPVFSMVIDTDGMQYYKPTTDIMHGKFHSIDFREDNQYIYTDIASNRILGDGRSAQIFLDDLFCAYKGKALLADDYLGFLEHIEQTKESVRYKENKTYLEREFSDNTYPVHPNTDRRLDDNLVAKEGCLTETYSNINDKLYTLAKELLISRTAFFSLCAALAIMDYNATDKAALTWGDIGRYTEQEQRIFGSLHRDIPIKIQRLNATKNELLKQARQQMRQGIAHSQYPYTLTKPNTERWNYAVNVLQQPSMQAVLERAPFPMEILFDEETEKLAYSLLDIEIYDEKELTIVFRYSATHYKQKSMQRFAALVRKNAEWLLSE